MTLNLSYIMYLVAHRDAASFAADLPDGHRSQGANGNGARPLKDAKHAMQPLLKETDPWFDWLDRAARTRGHYWWPKLREELQSSDPSSACVKNLASFFTRWNLHAAPFLRAVCRMAAERTRTDGDPEFDDTRSESETELDESEYYGADERPWHKLSVQYWPTLGKLLPAFAAELAAADPHLRLWRAPKKEGIKENPLKMMRVEDDSDWMQAIEHAADVQARLGRTEMMEGLAEAARVINGDPTRQPAAKKFIKSQQDTRTRWERKVDQGKLSRADADAAIEKQRQEFQPKQAQIQLKAKTEGAQSQADLEAIMDASLATASEVAQQPPVFSLPGTIRLSQPRPVPQASIVPVTEHLHSQGALAAAGVQPSAHPAMSQQSAHQSKASTVSIAPISITAEGASAISVRVQVQMGQAPKRVEKPARIEFRLPTARDAALARARETERRAERSRKRKREPKRQKKKIYDPIYDDVIDDPLDVISDSDSEPE